MHFLSALQRLGGGYGRGEGGLFRITEDGPPSLYNDLEFFLFMRSGIPLAAKGWAARWEREGTQELGIDVEFKLLPASALQAAQPTQFLHDLMAGHRFVAGDLAPLSTAPAKLLDAAAIPLSEATRLLFNRGSGLLFARWRLEEGDASALGFAERNQAKAKLALADAVLTANKRHHASVVERARRVREEKLPTPPDWNRIQAWHTEGVEFKLRPRHRQTEADALRQSAHDLEEVWLRVFLWLEEKRLGASFDSGPAYAASSGRLFPDTPTLRNFALHLRDRLRRGGALPGWTDYPRSALLRALVQLLSSNDEKVAATCLGTTTAGLRESYRRWWSLYN